MSFILSMAWRDTRASRRRLTFVSLSIVLGIAALVGLADTLTLRLLAAQAPEHETAAAIRDQALRTGHMVDNLLEMARWSAGQVRPRLEWHAWAEVIEASLRHLGEAKLRERLPQIYELAVEYLGVDPAREPIPVLPAVHYTMGGILANGRTAAPLAGLYSAGECSSVGIHGANRLGSNSLTELLVFGKVAGESAARCARTTSRSASTTGSSTPTSPIGISGACSPMRRSMRRI